jgi:uncharacterized repeat protein (TIGR02543 family)
MQDISLSVAHSGQPTQAVGRDTSTVLRGSSKTCLRHGVILIVLAVLALSVLTISPASATARPTRASQPRHVTSVAGDNSATVRFLPPSSNGGYRVNRYDIKTYPTNRVYNCLSTDCHIGGLAAGTPYFFQVAAVTKVGRGAYSWPSKVVTPTGSVTITFNANGGIGTMAPETKPYHTTAALTPNTFTYVGYTFTGWNTKANGSGTGFIDGALVKFTGGATFYAQWTVATAPSTTATITFNANGGIGTMAPETETLNASAALTTNTFTRTGYTFTGWNTTASDTGTSFTNSEVVQFTTSITLYAQWTAVPTATLSLSPNSLTSAGGTVILTYSSENATTCTLTSSPSIWTAATEPVACNGTYQDNVASTTSSREWTFTFTASNTSGQSTTSTQTLVESAPITVPFSGQISSNWSGYVLPTTTLDTEATGEWTVPRLNCADTPNGDSSTWVGIGGVTWSDGSSSGSLLQTGVNDNCVNGVQVDSGWWEIVPMTPNHEEAFSNFPISPGNTIEAIVGYVNGQWVTDLENLNTGLSAVFLVGTAWDVMTTATSTPVGGIQGYATGTSYSGAYSVEWIEEDVTSADSGSLFALPNYGSVTFFNLRTSILSGWSLSANDANEIVGSNGAVLSVPGAVSNDDFTVTYTGP